MQPILYLCSVHSVAPLVLTEPSATNATISENFTLNCNASGYPVPTILWTHNGTTVDENENDRATITPSTGSRSVLSVLTVSMGAINDSGDYACIVSTSVNDFQNITGDPVTVLVQGKTGCITRFDRLLDSLTHTHTPDCVFVHIHIHTLYT